MRKKITVRDRAIRVALQLIDESFVRAVAERHIANQVYDWRLLMSVAYRRGWDAAKADARRNGGGA